MDQDNFPVNPVDCAARLKDVVRRDQVATALFDETLAQFLGVNLTDCRCLEILSLNGRLTAGQLAGHAKLTTGAVTALVDRLERSGYVRRVRDGVDRRKVWIEVTELLDNIIQRIFGQYADIGALVTRYFSPEELAAIIRYLEMNAAITRERARLLLQYTAPVGSDTDRLLQARAFERDAEIMSRKAHRAYAAGQTIGDETFET